jgi:hypothetical protein
MHWKLRTISSPRLMKLPLQLPRNPVRTLPTSPFFAFPLTKFTVPSVCHPYDLEEADLLAPSWSFNIIISVQFALILTATALSLYDYF